MNESILPVDGIACEVVQLALEDYYSTPPSERDYWICSGCGRGHPDWHDECWWCRPTGSSKKEQEVRNEELGPK